MRGMPTEPFGLKLDAEQLGALDIYKRTLMEPVGGGGGMKYLIVSGLMTQPSSVGISVPERYLILESTTGTYICGIG